jgi:hypothetical protein
MLRKVIKKRVGRCQKKLQEFSEFANHWEIGAYISTSVWVAVFLFASPANVRQTLSGNGFDTNGVRHLEHAIFSGEVRAQT